MAASHGVSAPWSAWARRGVTVVLVFHITAIIAGGLSVPPSSRLERAAGDFFAFYYDLIDQGYAYRYYAPEPPPTPVVLARIVYGPGRPEELVRLPDRRLHPRLLYQRHLALANALAADFQAAHQAGQQSRWAASYAHHLCREYGGERVVLTLQYHQIPNPQQVRDALSRPGAQAVDLDAEDFYTAPQRIGEFACDGS